MFQKFIKLLTNSAAKIKGYKATTTLTGTLNSWTETGMEGIHCAILGLSDLEAKKNPDGNAFANGSIYFLKPWDRISIFNKEGRMIWSNGKYLVKDSWTHSKKEIRFGSIPDGIQEEHWAYWCENHFQATVYLK